MPSTRMSVLSVFLLFRLTDARGAEHGEDLAAGLGFEQIAHCHVGPNEGHVNPKIRVGCLFDAVLGGGVEAETGEHQFAVPAPVWLRGRPPPPGRR